MAFDQLCFVVPADHASSPKCRVQIRSTESQQQLNTIDADLLSLLMHLPGSLQQTILGGAGVRRAVLHVLSMQDDSDVEVVDNAPHDHNRLVLEFVQGLLNELA